METSLPEKPRETSVPPVPLKTYQWEDVRRAKQQGGYPWTHLQKGPLEGPPVTAEAVLRDSAPTPASAMEAQKILMLDASPGSSRKLEGDEPARVPNFSKEISLDSVEDAAEPPPAESARPATPEALKVAQEPKITVSPKGILKRKHPPRPPPPPPAEESPRNSKCCHPLVEKIKHIADKTIHKSDKNAAKKVPTVKKKFIEEPQEIISLDCSPGSERRERQKLSAERQRDSLDEVKISLVMQTDSEAPEAAPEAAPDVFAIPREFLPEPSPPFRSKKEHIYEDIAEDKYDQILPMETDETEVKETRDTELVESEKPIEPDAKSGASNDPSLLIDDPIEDEESTSESITKLKAMYDTAMSPDKKIEVEIQNDDIVDIDAVKEVIENVDVKNDEIIKDEMQEDEIEKDEIQVDGLVSEPDEVAPDSQNVSQPANHSPNIIISEITDDELEEQKLNAESEDCTTDKRVHFETSESTSDPEPVEESPKADSENVWSKISDHEYEPVGKPRPAEVSAEESADDVGSLTSQERRVLQEADNAAFSEGSDPPPGERFNTPTTTESRTDCEVSTSQVDSSALEDLPLKRENRSRLQQRIRTQTGKLRSQAGKLKTKIKTMKKPQFSRPEMPKFEKPSFSLPERPKFKMPDRPKINLPDRPKFSLPERPKFNLPERPKFNLPDRPKFNFPDRPKFNLPDRPKFSMPKSKFKFPDRPKINFGSFGRNKDKSAAPAEDADVDADAEEIDKSTESTSGSVKKPHFHFDFRTYPRFFNRNKKNKADPSTSAERPGTPPPGFATVPRVKRQEMVSSHWTESSATSAEGEPRNYGVGSDYSYENDRDFQSKLAQVDKDYRQMQEEYEKENEQIQKSVKAKIENAELWNAMERNTAQKLEHGSSLPHIPAEEPRRDDSSQPGEDDESSAASTGHHRRGVLEEIDNDEFFLRQKGISQDNIEVGKYLSDEIRDAFRSPVNALSQMDEMNGYARPNEMDDSNLDMGHLNDEYYKFSRTDVDDIEEFDDRRQEDMAENDDGYYTFPPVRPSRARKAKAKAQAQAEAEVQAQAQAYESNKNIAVEDQGGQRYIVQNATVNFNNLPPPEMFSEPSSNIKYEEEKPIEPPKRKNVFSYKEPDIMDNLNEYENEMEQTRDMPPIPRRRKRSLKDFDYSENGSFCNENFDKDDWLEPKFNSEDKMNEDEIVHREEYIIASRPEPDSTEGAPALPRRTRSRSRGSRATSAADDDRTSRGADSITLDSHPQLPTNDLDFLDDLDDGPGYATVDKVSQRNEAPPRPPAPFRRHRSDKSLSQQSDRQFFTVPRPLKDSPPPKRPLRNYSTLGPSRPPRKKSTTSLTNSEDFRNNDSSLDITQYVEIDDEEVHKDLQSGDVINKMKDRPLPAPPRPPRGPRKKKDFQDKLDYNDDAVVISDEFDSTLNAESQQNNNIENMPIKKIYEYKVDQQLPADAYEQEEVIEIEVSTQTDPLPDDFDYDLGMDEPFDDRQDYLSHSATEHVIDRHEDIEENSIDAEILSKGLQKFRESSRPTSRSGRSKTPSDRPKTPSDRPKTPLGRMSPTAILVERRVSSPTRINEREEVVTEASLTVQPIDDPFSYELETRTVPLIPEEDFKPYPTHSEICKALGFVERKSPVTVQNTVDRCISPIATSVAPAPVERCISPITSTAAPTSDDRCISPLFQTAPQSSVDRCISPVIAAPAVAPDTVFQPHRTEEASNRPDSFRSLIPSNTEVDVLRTERLQVSDLEVERLSVSELQAHKILVSEIEGLSLQVGDLNSKSGNIVLRGLELAPGILEEILQKFSQLAAPSAPVSQTSTQTTEAAQPPRPATSQEETQTDVEFSPLSTEPPSPPLASVDAIITERLIPMTAAVQLDAGSAPEPPERPPLPQIPPMYPLAYYPEYSMPPPSFYRLRSPQDRHTVEASDDEAVPSAPSRRRKHKREPVSSSEEEYRHISRRAPPRASEPSVSELSVQLFRACQNSVSRTIRYILSLMTSHFGGGDDKKDMQMALVIFLVMIAGLIMLGVGEGRTVHHHHWDFFNPPTNEK